MGQNNPRTVSAALEQELFDFVENYRWDNRVTRASIVTQAVEEWALKHGYNKRESVSQTGTIIS